MPRSVLMRVKRFTTCAFVLALGLVAATQDVLADDADEVIAKIVTAVAQMKAADPAVVPMAFWDFDGTIIKGDVSEGLNDGDKHLFKGLMQRAIEEGFTTSYEKSTGWETYKRDYARLNELGTWLAWPFNAQLFGGCNAKDLEDFCRREHRAIYRKWYFSFSDKVFRALTKAGVENYVISGSPDVFVRGASEELGIPREHIRGIRVRELGGRMTTQLVYPMPFAEGKIQNLRDFVGACPHGVAIAAFGNSYFNDAPFMRYVATQPDLPGGVKGVAVMINGIKLRPGYSEHFIKINATDVVGQ